MAGKLEQYEWLSKNPETSFHLPDSSKYSKAELSRYVKKYHSVFVKRDLSGQGRGVYRVTERKQGVYRINGYTFSGQLLKEDMSASAFHQLLQPFERLGREDKYIIQQAVESAAGPTTPFVIRSHVQRVNGIWEVPGHIVSIGVENTKENAIVNNCRGAQVISVEALFEQYLQEDQRVKVLEQLEDVCKKACQSLEPHYDSKEFGLDITLNQQLIPIIIEVNKNAGIASFHTIDASMWKRIMENRRKIKKESTTE